MRNIITSSLTLPYLKPAVVSRLGDDFASQSLTAIPEAKIKIWFQGGPEVDKVTSPQCMYIDAYAWLEMYEAYACALMYVYIKRSLLLGFKAFVDLAFRIQQVAHHILRP